MFKTFGFTFLVAGLGGVVAGLGTACTNDFEDCELRRTCPPPDASDGSAPSEDPEDREGDGADAPPDDSGSDADGDATDSVDADGASDGAAPIRCASDADCDDGMACNGGERCESGECAAGSALCEAADPEHCSVRCIEGDGGMCVVEARDGDGDGHGTALCEAAPGDDCDDARDDVFAGTTEVCDGLDNDCDGLDDFEDGLGLGGTPLELPVSERAAPRIAWSPTGRVFGAVWFSAPQASTKNAFFSLLSPEGAPIGVESFVTEELSVQPRIARGDADFGVAWFGTGLSIPFQRLSDTGETLLPVPANVVTLDSTSGVLDLAFLPGHGWYVAYEKDDELYIRGMGTDGESPGGEQRIGGLLKNAPLALVAGTEDLRVAWTETDARARTRPVRPDLALGLVQQVAAPQSPLPSDLVDAAGALHWDGSTEVLAFSRPRAGAGEPIHDLNLIERTASGSVVCASELLDPGGAAQAIAPYAGGHVVLIVHATQGVKVARFGTNCEPLGEPLVVSQVLGASYMGASLAAGDDGFLVAWAQANSGALSKILTRQIGPNLCD